ncbi:aromatic ring-hydroxylating dioxygenase subunit alpha [Haladaptatus sp. DJG-WS-42]|uniref:aromatic ring-hydroxylating oxygenase subunit alpha n=1 Tax=Haladaptatus sp. DJG-WS-42 TaxID=3120516 RepID=UPI0030CE0E81
MRIFNSDALHRAELDRIFGRSWIFVGHESEIASPGDYRLRYIGENPFIFVRDEHEDIHVLFDSCRHRGAKLCRSEKGNTSHFRCPYHGWTYKNTGELVGVPKRQQGFGHLDLAEFSLHEPPHVSNYHGLIFASLDPNAPSLAEFLGDARWYLDLIFGLIDLEVVGEPERWETEIDWKSLADNSAGDNYHLPVAHRSAMTTGIGSQSATKQKDDSLLAICCDALSLSMYQIHDTDWYWGYPPEIVETFAPDGLTDAQLTLAKESNTTVATVFPNFTFHHGSTTHDPNKPPRSFVTIRMVQPLAPGRSEIWNWFLLPKDAPEAYKQEAYDAGVGARSASGGFTVDDIAILDGIAELAQTSFARTKNLELDYSMGMSDGSEASLLEDWEGPGEAYDHGGVTDVNQLHFYRNWIDTMTQD